MTRALDQRRTVPARRASAPARRGAGVVVRRLQLNRRRRRAWLVLLAVPSLPYAVAYLLAGGPVLALWLPAAVVGLLAVLYVVAFLVRILVKEETE